MDVKRLIKERTSYVFLFVCLAVLALCARLFYLQILHKNEYTQLATSQRLRPVTIDAQRGNILDRNDTVLAMSIQGDAVYAIPSAISDPNQVASQLEPYLSLTEEQILNLLNSTRQSVWLERRLEPEQARAIRNLHLPGIRLETRPQRYYPQGQLAAQVLGIAGVDNQGLEGLEYYYDDILKGVAGSLRREQDAAQRDIPGGNEHFIPPKPGHDLVLTIDRVIQHIAERELLQAINETGSEYGSIVMVNPQTGEILANAVYPFYDPNNYQQYPSGYRRNIVATNHYEPGSTFKVVTTATGIELGFVDEDTEFESRRVWEVGGGRIRNVSGQSSGTITFRKAVEESDNIVFAKLAVEMGPQAFYPFIRAFGFGDRLGLDFPGEAYGQVAAPGEIRHGETLQWANIGFGQGIAVTPLQMLMAVATVANQGTLMKPHYLSEIRDYNGRVVEKSLPQVLAQPVSPVTAERVKELLRLAVVNGTGSRADILGFQVAGKTGTAEVPEQGGYGDKRIASFVGFAPKDDPQVAALVMLHNPQTEVKYGGVVAAPVFHRVMEQTLEHLNVSRKQGSLNPSSMVVVPNVRNFPLIEAQVALAENDLQWNYHGDGAVVQDQVPIPGSRVPPQTTVNLFFYEQGGEETVTVPSVVGKSMRDVSVILAEAGLRLRIKGSGIARTQKPAAESRVPKGSVIEVEFLP